MYNFLSNILPLPVCRRLFFSLNNLFNFWVTLRHWLSHHCLAVQAGIAKSTQPVHAVELCAKPPSDHSRESLWLSLFGVRGLGQDGQFFCKGSVIPLFPSTFPACLLRHRGISPGFISKQLSPTSSLCLPLTFTQLPHFHQLDFT